MEKMNTILHSKNNTMLNNNSFYNEEELKIFVDYFVYKNDSCKINFLQYLENFVTVHGKRISDQEAKDKSLRPYSHGSISANLSHWDYSGEHMLVNNVKKDNIVTYILSNPSFVPTSSRIKDINKLRPDWNHVNIDGDNALHLLAKNNTVSGLDKLINELAVKTDLKNKNGEYFINLLVNSKNFTVNSRDNADFIIREISSLEKIRKCCVKFSDLLEKSSLTKLKHMSSELDLINTKMLTHIEQNVDLQNKRIVNFYYETHKEFNDTLNFYILNKKVKKQVQPSIPRNKI